MSGIELNWDTFVSTLTGGIVAGLIGYIFEILRERTRARKEIKLLKTAIIDDLKHSIPLYEKIALDWQEEQTIWSSTLEEIFESRFAYHNNKDNIHFFDDFEIRRRIFGYYLKSSVRLNSLKSHQERKFELDREISKTYYEIKKIFSNKTEHEIIQMVNDKSIQLNKRYERLLFRMLDQVNNLNEIKAEAQELIAILEKAKN